MKENTKQFFRKTGFWIKKHAPELLNVAGTGLVIGGTISACKVTRNKLDDALGDIDGQIRFVKEIENSNEFPYTEDDRKADLARAYASGAVSLIGLYAGPAASIGAGLGCMHTATKITKNRLITVSEKLAVTSATLGAIASDFNDYRSRVANEVGEEKEKEIRYGITTETVKEKVKDETTGKTKTVTKEVKSIKDPENLNSPTVKIFDRHTAPDHCTGDPIADRFFLECLLNRWEFELRHGTRHHSEDGTKYLLLNDMLHDAGLAETKAGCTLAVKFDPNKPEDEHQIDIGLYAPINEEFLDGAETAAILDFRVTETI